MTKTLWLLSLSGINVYCTPSLNQPVAPGDGQKLAEVTVQSSLWASCQDAVVSALGTWGCSAGDRLHEQGLPFPHLAEGPDLQLLPPKSISPQHSELTIAVYKLKATCKGMPCKPSHGRHGNAGDTRVWGGLLLGDRQTASHCNSTSKSGLRTPTSELSPGPSYNALKTVIPNAKGPGVPARTSWAQTSVCMEIVALRHCWAVFWVSCSPG